MGPGLLTIVSAPGPIAIAALPLAGACVGSSSHSIPVSSFHLSSPELPASAMRASLIPAKSPVYKVGLKQQLLIVFFHLRVKCEKFVTCVGMCDYFTKMISATHRFIKRKQ